MPLVLDRIDKKILAELERDARLTHNTLSERVGLSPSPCTRRIRKLEAEGFITGYRAQIDESKVGYGFSVFVSVKLDTQVDNRLVSFETNIQQYPEVVDCWLMMGNRDYLLRVAVSDISDFEIFLTGSLTKIEGVASIESAIPIRRVKGPNMRI